MKLHELVKRLEDMRLEPRLYIGESARYEKDWMSLFACVPEYIDAEGKKVTRQESLICFGLHLDGKPRDDEAGYRAKLAETSVAKALARYAPAVALADAEWERDNEAIRASA